MATYTYTSGAEDFWSDYAWWNFYVDDYTDIDNGDGTQTVQVTLLEQSAGDPNGYDEIVISVTFTEDDLHDFEEGPFAGDGGVLLGGSLDSINYYNDSNLMLSITDLPDYLLPYLTSLLSGTNDQDGFFQNFYPAIQNIGNEYIGVNNGNVEDGPADRVTTGSGKDRVNTKNGDDTIFDMGGKDNYNGGAGYDKLTYSEVWWNPTGVKRGLNVNLETGKIVGWDGKRDTVKNIEHVEGTFMDDIFLGDANDNTFEGLQGADQFDGNGGFNRLEYKGDADYGGFDGIKVWAATQTVRDGFGFTDTYENIQRISGTNYRDSFIDDDSSMYYDGRDGNDVFRIRGGNDTLRGRDGEDEFRFIGNVFGDNEIRDWEKGVDVVVISRLTNMNQLNIYQDGNDAVVEFTRYATHSSIVFQDTDVNDLTVDVFGF